MCTDGRTDGRTDRQTDIMKLILAFRNFAKGPKNNDLASAMCDSSEVLSCPQIVFLFTIFLRIKSLPHETLLMSFSC